MSRVNNLAHPPKLNEMFGREFFPRGRGISQESEALISGNESQAVYIYRRDWLCGC